ncbi:hypothetical protein [Agromyces italicus]|uniref:hypothetical protein n=1 Tax=Agromyces italicus TaxID=279572 RepID=UPI0003B48B6F|nr:hypothetical protein [Agromyces italicus]
MKSVPGAFIAIGVATMGGGFLWMQFAGFGLVALIVALGGAALWVTAAAVVFLSPDRSTVGGPESS